MKRRMKWHALPALVAIMLLALAQTALGATAAGTSITNTAQVDYEVNGVAKQKTSTTATFVVDSKIRLVVENQDSNYVSALPGVDTSAPLKFLVTNDGNEMLDFDLTVVDFASTASPYNSATESDNINLDTYSIYIDDGDGTWEGTGTETAYDGVNGVQDLDYDRGATTYNTVVWVIPDIPDAAADGDIAAVHLVATATQYNSANTAVPASSTAAPADGSKDVYLADDAAPTEGGSFTAYAGDTANDGEHSDYGAWKVSTADMDVDKSVASSSGFFVPGEDVTYTISITNNWSLSATSVVITDDIDSSLAFKCGSEAVNSGTISIAYDTDGDGYDDACSGTYDSTVQSVELTIDDIGSGNTVNVTFDAQIQ